MPSNAIDPVGLIARWLRTTGPLVVTAGLTLGACQSGPSAADYMGDARRAVEQARFEEAQTYVGLAEEAGTSERKARLLRAQIARRTAKQALQEQRDARAFEQYVTAGDTDPRRKPSAEAYLKALEIGRRRGQPPVELAELAEKAAGEDASSARARRMAAQMWDEAGNYEEALSHYLWLWKSEASSDKIGRRLATIYATLDRKNDAITVLEDVVEDDPDSVQARINLAGLYAETGEPERAKKIYEQLVEQHPTNSGILLRYSRFLRRRGEGERADELEKRAYDNMPGVESREMRDLQ